MPLYTKTPVIEMLDFCSEQQKVSLKMDAFQPSGSFKLRGMDCIARHALEIGATKLISSSGGNAGLSAAYAGRKLGLSVTVIVPSTTPASTLKKLEAEGAEALVYGDVWDEADQYARKLVTEQNALYVPPFDHEKLWEGHASLVDELKEQCTEQPDLIICSVGGGGLLSGIATGLRRNGWTDTHILAVETIGADSYYQASLAGKPVTIPAITSIATSLGAKKVAPRALEDAKDITIIPQLVTDESAARACLRFADEYRTIVEPACGASLSVVYDQADIIKNYRHIVVEVCGGANITLTKLLSYKTQFHID